MPRCSSWPTTSRKRRRILDSLEGNLTGAIYSDIGGSDDTAYEELAPQFAAKVGRLLNDKMPTGVAVSSAMNHGGPYPATGHPGFTAVGIPASLRRFTGLECYDNVRTRSIAVGACRQEPQRPDVAIDRRPLDAGRRDELIARQRVKDQRTVCRLISPPPDRLRQGRRPSAF